MIERAFDHSIINLAQNKENIIPYINNGFIIKLYGVRSETNTLTDTGKKQAERTAQQIVL